jgi:hypothetical protein
MSTLTSDQRMLSWLMGSGYQRYRQNIRDTHRLMRALAGDDPVVSLEIQDRVHRLFRQHGGRFCRSYARSLERAAFHADNGGTP